MKSKFSTKEWDSRSASMNAMDWAKLVPKDGMNGSKLVRTKVVSESNRRDMHECGRYRARLHWYLNIERGQGPGE